MEHAMAKQRKAGADPCADGWAALRASRWAPARTAFAAAIAAAESPEAQEGLSWAAWWLDDAAAVFAARERAYHLYRRRGDAASAARLATWLAADELDFHGADAVARGWLRRAHRLLDPLEPGAAHGWLAFQDGYVAHAGGDTEAARERGAVAAELGRRLGVADLEMLGLALEGSALVSSARVEEGMRFLDEATATALEGQAEIPISAAWACCFLVTACTAVLDLDRAGAWCDRIAEFADRHGSRYMLAFCRAEYGAVHLLRGSWQQAESLLEAAVDDFSVSRPAWVGAPVAGLAELRRRQGRADEAERLLGGAGGRRALACRARLALDRGDVRRAAEIADRLLRATPPGRLLDRAPALELLAHACITRGELDRAASALAALREALSEVGTAPYRAALDLAGGRYAAAVADHERARTLLEDAVDGYGRGGLPFETARARAELATLLVATGRAADGATELAAAREAFAALGARWEVARVERLLDAYTRTSAGTTGDGLTPRERDVVRLLADGLTNRQIAERLVVSEHTVHRHVTNILRKLDLPSRTAAAAYAVRLGLVDE
jgi:DNA-binding CsgD family transcriptional regulator